MRIDCHVHTCAFTPAHGKMSAYLLKTLPFRFMRWRLGMKGADAKTEQQVERLLFRLLDETPQIDAAVVLGFDAVHDGDGRFDDARTHLYVTNDYAADLAKRHGKILFGASVHPYRKDAVAEVERCVAAGAVLLKWLPIVQDFNPADARCFPVYEALAHYKLPLLCHTGGEKSLPNLNTHVADPMLLVPALERGVTVIAAHCGTRSASGETDFVANFMRLAHDYEHCYGDTAALNLPTRDYAYERVMGDAVVRSKLVHGSDWPILPVPPVMELGIGRTMSLMFDKNWLRRDCRIKEALGFEEAYWHRAGKVLRVERGAGVSPT
jgi:predicted TIM-barrel fold metal-dependent hydrolase